MKIAIVKLSALGDIVHAMIVLQYIKKYNPIIEIDWVVEESYKGLLQFNPDINKIHIVNIKKAKKKKSLYLLINELRKVRQFGPYDLVIDLQGLLKSAIISALIPSSLSVGFEKYSIREGFASFFYNRKFTVRYHENIIKRNFELVKFALDLPFKLEEVQDKLPFLYSRNKHVYSRLSSTKKNIVLIPGASCISKRYPVEKFSELTNLLDANYLVIWESDKEKLLASEIKKLSPHVNICEKLTIEALISLIAQVDLVIGPDTGPTHMGWALNTPSITLFGPTPGYRNTFSSEFNKIIESKSIVNPYKINKNDQTIRDISIPVIVKVAKSLLLK